MPKGRVNKKVHSNNGVLCKFSQHQRKANIEIAILEEKTTYNKEFNELMQIMCMSHSVKGKYVINVNGLTVDELNNLLSRLESN